MSLAVGVPTAFAQLQPAIWSVQLHAGLFTPIDASGSSPSVGMRYGKHFGPHLQGGLLSGWTLKSKKLETPSDGPESGDSRVELGRFDAHLVPVMGFMQVNFTAKSRLVPFVGFGGGYEWLILDGKNHQTGQTSKATYGNVAWETYGGVGIRLNSEVRLNSELFYNGGSLERDAGDATGRIWREAVHVNGVGVRVGVDMVFE